MEGTRTDGLSVRLLDSISILLEFILLILKSIFLITQSIYRTFFPIMEKSVKGEIVLITGAGRGIGKELALQYAALGATVICWGITREKNLATVEEIAQMGYPMAYFYECDVSNQKSVMETAKKVQQEVGDVTILVNNAGILHLKPLLEQTVSDIENTININLMSHFWTIQAFLPAMIKKNHGHIVANSSLSGIMGITNGNSYCASKHAIRGLMESLFQDLRLNPSSKIKLTTIYSYFVKTEIIKKVYIRFPSIMPVFEPSYVAKEIISAQRRDIFESSIPSYILYASNLYRLFPIAVYVMIFDFTKATIEE